MQRKLLIAGIIAIVGLYMLSFTASKPHNIGLQGKSLAKLPESPNAISSQTDDESRYVPPIDYSEFDVRPLKIILQVLEAEARCEIIEQQTDYLHAEFTSLVFRFVDDVEFYIDRENKKIHFRSASRVGYSDLGANRRRLVRLKKEIEARLSV